MLKFSDLLNFRLSSETLAEVEQKDIYVRLQEIFRDRKVALEQSLSNIELQYEHIVQVLTISTNYANKQNYNVWTHIKPLLAYPM